MTKPHASDLRKGRVSIPGQIYLVSVRYADYDRQGRYSDRQEDLHQLR